MLRSLFSGISGLRANQTMLDVTGNNIANANTVGFKASSTIFQDTLSQTLRGAGAPQVDRGGTNATQIGLGVQVAGVQANMGQGSAQTTGRPTDTMIQGDGFFVMRVGEDGRSYTRNGSFGLDATGRLVNTNGLPVQGYDYNDLGGYGEADLRDIYINQDALNAANPPVDPNATITAYNITADGRVIVSLSDGTESAVAQLAIADFQNPGGLIRSGETTFTASANSGQPEFGAAGTGGAGTLLVGALEMSNVDLAGEFTNLILAQRGFQASSRLITTSDSVLEELVNLKR